MTTLQVRRPPFRIDDSVPFQWQPANPAFGLFTNTFTFIAIAFERYVVSATRLAMPRFTDPAIAEEANSFVKQEAAHAKAHRAHAKALISRYPGLQATLDAANAAYDELLATEDVEFHLAYVASLEATFTPLFKMALDNRASLFEGGDERVGTLFLWHFVEEIEHRSSAFVIHRAVTPSGWYRIRQTPKVIRHVSSVYNLIVDGFEEHVPLADHGGSTSVVRPMRLGTSEVRARLQRLRRRARERSMLADVPGRELRSMLWHLAKTQTPGHDPAEAQLPTWADEWHTAFDAGDDITTYTGARL